MFLSAWATKQMNAADPDCGTSFTWAARALGPKLGWFAGGWGTIAADLLAMASYSQVAAQYVFLLIGAKSIGNDATSVWVLVLGIGWIVVLTWLCWRGIEISARIQITLVVVEVIILLVMAIVALIKVANGSAPGGHLDPTWSWFNPLKFGSFDSTGQPGAQQRRPLDARQLDLRQLHGRLDPQPPAAVHGADLGRGDDPDEDPPERPHDAVDGVLQGVAGDLRQDPSALTRRRRSRRSRSG
jgi:hypothetical protein